MKKKNIKIIALVSVLLIAALYMFVNFSYIVTSFKVHNMVANNDIKNNLFQQYLVQTANVRVSGCSLDEKLLSLPCSKGVSQWALGEYSKILDDGLAK